MNIFSQRVMQKALAARPWVRKVAPNRYRVTPRTAEHGKYELTVSYEDGCPVIESCVDYRTGEVCLGFQFSGQCYHSCRLVLHLLSKMERAA